MSRTIGIITIHKINNYGSVLQAFALQSVCEKLGYRTEIINYEFPNAFHLNNEYAAASDSIQKEPILIKLLYANALNRQHKGIQKFVAKRQHLSARKYYSPEQLFANPPKYDIYVTGSDQLWNPRHCNGDPAFMLHFAPDEALKISYAASAGGEIPETLHPLYKECLSRYAHISVRENSGVEAIKNITGKNIDVVLDPTLLLDRNQWNEIAVPEHPFKRKYILCYFLNYTFNAFPYVDELARNIQKQTGYEIMRVARPPHRLEFRHNHYDVGASPEEFLALVRDAEMVITTSFHGTAFAVNYGKPVFTVVKNKKQSEDSRQASLMHSIGLDDKVLSLNDGIPDVERTVYDHVFVQKRLEVLRCQSIDWLKRALDIESDL